MPLEDPAVAFTSPVMEATEAADEADFLLQLFPEASAALKAPRKGLETPRVPVEDTGADSTAAPLLVGGIVVDLLSPELEGPNLGTAELLGMGELGEVAALLAPEEESATAPLLAWEEAGEPGLEGCEAATPGIDD